MLALSLLLSACTFFTTVHAAENIVQTPLGAVRGLVFDKYRLFQAVPYATPPIGNRRWQPPEPVQPWHPRVVNGTTQAPGCPQKCWCVDSHIPDVVQDCLRLG